MGENEEEEEKSSEENVETAKALPELIDRN
jgi:hypothetical protein